MQVFQHPVVRGIRDEQIVAGISRDLLRSEESARSAAGSLGGEVWLSDHFVGGHVARARFAAGRIEGRVEYHDAAVASVRNVNVVRTIQRDPLRPAHRGIARRSRASGLLREVGPGAVDAKGLGGGRRRESTDAVWIFEYPAVAGIRNIEVMCGVECDCLREAQRGRAYPA